MVLTGDGRADFRFTNHSQFDVIVDWKPTFEVRRSQDWEPVAYPPGGGQFANPLFLKAHDASSMIGVALPERRREAVWRLRLKVYSSEGEWAYWFSHPRELWDALQFLNSQGRFGPHLGRTTYPTASEITTVPQTGE